MRLSVQHPRGVGGNECSIGTGSVYYYSMKTHFVALVVFFIWRLEMNVFVLVLITMCDEKHEQRMNVKFLIKFKKKLRLSAVSC